MSTPLEAFELLRAEIERALPTQAAAAVLAHPLAELARVLETDAAGPALDQLEDLLEAVMQQSGWACSGAGPSANSGSGGER